MAVERAPVFSARNISWIYISWRSWRRFPWRWPLWTCKNHRPTFAPTSRPRRRLSWSIMATQYWKTKRSNGTLWRTSLADTICLYRIRKWPLLWRTCSAWVLINPAESETNQETVVELYPFLWRDEKLHVYSFHRNSSCCYWMQRTRIRIPSPPPWWPICVRSMNIWDAKVRASSPATPCAASTASWCRGCSTSGSPASTLPTSRYRRLWYICGGTCITCTGSTLSYRAVQPIRISLITINCNR